MLAALNRKTCPLLLFLMAFSVSFAVAGPSQVDGNIRERVTQVLEREGYLAHFSNGQDLQRGVSAYLWDHRQSLKSVDFHNAVQVDVLVCLLINKGYPGFNKCIENKAFMGRCQGFLR